MIPIQDCSREVLKLLFDRFVSSRDEKFSVDFGLLVEMVLTDEVGEPDDIGFSPGRFTL